MDDGIPVREFHAAEGVGDWRAIGDGACTFFPTDSFTTCVRLVEAIGRVVGDGDHRPDVDVRRDGVTVRLITITDDWYGLTRRDLDLARRISAAARELGLAGDPSAVQSVLVVPGAPDIAAIMPFWRAVLGYVPRADSPDEDLVDPRDRGPALWFETMEEPRADGGGSIHIAVWVPYEQAEARLARAIAAGGRVVRDRAPAWWTLADPAGNEADISTAMGRD